MMKRFLFALCFCAVLFVSGFAQENFRDNTSVKAHSAEVATNNAIPDQSPQILSKMMSPQAKNLTSLIGSTAYAINHYGGPVYGFVKFNVDAAEQMIQAAPFNILLYSGEYYNGIWYGYDNSYNFYKVNYETGEYSVTSTALSNWAADMAYDYSTGNMYGTLSGKIFTCDLETGLITEIGETGGIMLRTLAVDLNGNMYGIEDGANGRFYSINKETAELTFIGATGLACNYVQSMGFDHNTGILYWCQYGLSGSFCSIDVVTGRATMLANGVGEMSSFFIPYTLNRSVTEKPSGFTVNPASDESLKATLSWTNPIKDIDGNTLSTITSIVIKRGSTIIHTIDNPIPGAQLSYTDNTIPDSGIYNYQIYATTSEGEGYHACANEIPVGSLCNVIIEMSSSNNGGWNGSAIQILKDGNVVAHVTLGLGGFRRAEVLVPKGELEFLWVAGLNDFECSFVIYDAFDVDFYHAVYVPAQGVFYTWENTCSAPPTTTISGTITSLATGNPIEGALISFKGSASRSTTTNNAGQYTIEPVTGFTYDIHVSASGYNNVKIEGYEVTEVPEVINHSLTNPILTVTPPSLNINTNYMVNASAAVTLINEGNGPMSFGFNRDYAEAINYDSTGEAWELVTSFNASSKGQQGLVFDGEYIYTSYWSTGGQFSKYTAEGEFIETFTLIEVPGIRDLTYDGAYFYGSTGGSNLYKMDLASHEFVEMIETEVTTIRHCTYDPDKDGFWVGDWNDLSFINRQGEVLFNSSILLPEAYSSGYDNFSEEGPYLYFFCQPTMNAIVIQYNIATDTRTEFLFDFKDTPAYLEGSTSGGSYIGEYKGDICFFGNAQQPGMGTPNLIGIYKVTTSGWLTVDVAAGSINPGESKEITLNVDGWYAESGTYSATANFYGRIPNVATASIDVTFTINPPACDSPQNLEIAVVDYNTMHLTWDAPENAEGLEGYGIYYGNNTTAFATLSATTTSYDDTNLVPGEYCYCVRAYFENDCISERTDIVCVTATEQKGKIIGIITDQTTGSPIEGATVALNNYVTQTASDGAYSIEEIVIGEYIVTAFAPEYKSFSASQTIVLGENTLNVELTAAPCVIIPVNLTATIEDNNMNLQWSLMNNNEQWITNGGDYSDAIGPNQATLFMVAHRYEPTDLSEMDGMKISSVKFIPNNLNSAYTISIWSGGDISAPEKLILEQEVIASTIEIREWNEVILHTPITIDASKELWIGYRCNTYEAGQFAGCDNGPLQDGKGNMIFSDGSWKILSQLTGYTYNWCIQAFVEPNVASGVNDLKFNVYRDEEEIASGITVNSYSDLLPDSDVHCYTVTVLCSNNTESEPSNEICTNDVAIQSIDTYLLVYPNPANNGIFIKGYNIQQVIVFNSLGQIVERTNLSYINTSSYANGNYIIQILTNDNNMVSKKIIVQHDTRSIRSN